MKKIKTCLITITILAMTLMGSFCYKTSSQSFLQDSSTKAMITQVNTAPKLEVTSSDNSVQIESKSNENAITASNNIEEPTRVEQNGKTCVGSSLNNQTFNKLTQKQALCTKEWQLSIQDDGNVVLKNKGGVTIWSSGGKISTKSQLCLEINGIGILRTKIDVDKNTDYYWAQSKQITNKPGYYTFELQESGNLTIKSSDGTIVWNLFERQELKSVDGDKDPKSKLTNGQGIVSSKYLFFNDPNGTLRLFESGTEKWGIGIGEKDCVAIMQNDGNFVTYSSTGRATWASSSYRGIKANTTYSLSISNGKIIIKDSSNKTIYIYP